MQAIAVSRFDYEIVGVIERGRVAHDRIVRATEVAGEHDRAAVRAQRNERRAEDVAGWRQLKLDPAAEIDRDSEVHRLQRVQSLIGIGARIQRQRRMVF